MQQQFSEVHYCSKVWKIYLFIFLIVSYAYTCIYLIENTVKNNNIKNKIK